MTDFEDPLVALTAHCRVLSAFVDALEVDAPRSPVKHTVDPCASEFLPAEVYERATDQWLSERESWCDYMSDATFDVARLLKEKAHAAVMGQHHAWVRESGLALEEFMARDES